MEVARTLRFKLEINSEDAEKLHSLIVEYSKLVKDFLKVLKHSRAILKPSKGKLHRYAYHFLRKKYNLHSNHVTSARDRAVEMVKASAYHKVFPDPETVPVRMFRDKTFFLNGKRIKIVIAPREHVTGKLIGGQFDEIERARCAELIERDEEFFIHFIVKRKVNLEYPFVTRIGVDVNLERIAVSAVGEDGSVLATHLIEMNVKGRREYFLNRRRGNQRRKVRAGHEERDYFKNLIEQTTHQIITFIKNFEKPVVCLENLKNLIKRVRKRGGDVYPKFFYEEVHRRLVEKLTWEGIRVVFVPAMFTSVRCHRCGGYGKRYGKKFVCGKCGEFDADVNASASIARRLPALKGEVSRWL